MLQHQSRAASGRSDVQGLQSLESRSSFVFELDEGGTRMLQAWLGAR